MKLAEQIRVLLVEDNPTDAMVVRHELAHTTDTKFSVVHLERLSEALACLQAQRFDVVLLDLSLPDTHGLDTFVRLHDAVTEIPVVVLSGQDDKALAVKAVQAGAQDYLVKGHMGEDVLPRALRYAIERRRAERSLAESDERYRLLIERSPDAFLVHCEGKITFANAAAVKLFRGDSLDQLIGRTFLDFIASEHHSVLNASAEEAILYQANRQLELITIRLDGTRVTVDATCNAFCQNDQSGVQVVLRDITERKRSEERFRWLVNSNAQGILFWKMNGEVTDGNQAFLDMVGYTRREMEAGEISWAAMTPPEHGGLDEKALEEILLKGVCVPFEKDFIRKDGTRVPMLIGASVSEENPQEGICFMLDLTERNRLQQISLRNQRMESIGTLAGGIAHDLNNSLGPIITSIDLLKRKFPESDSQGLLSILGASAQRGADMVRQVLSFARGVEGRRMDVQVKHLVGEMQQIAYDTFPKNIRVRTNVPNDLWTVQGDPTQLHQVLLNLCMNSRDAMPTGGVLSLDAENVVLGADCPWLGKDAGVKPGSYILIEVTDSGPGMALEMIDRIFDPFFTTKEVGKGTGLGLSTSLAILKSHGGTFRVDGGLGHGAKFSVYLPAQAGPISAGAPEKPTELPRGNGESILVVDDDAGMRQVTQQTLEEFGYNVLVAFDGAEAVAIYARQSALIDAVITDVMMPVMDGPASIAVLRKMNPEVRIIAASGQSSGDHRALLASLGVNHYLSKPYTAEALLKALALVLADGEERMEDEGRSGNGVLFLL